MTNDVETTDRARAWADALRADYRPHRLMKSLAGLLYETISYPWAERDRVLVCVRVPGDPTTLITVDALDLSPEGRACYCDNPVRPEFYFVDAPADVERRRRDVEFLTQHARGQKS